MDESLKNNCPEEQAARKKPLHAGHRKRMRERFAESGFDGYQPHEMLEQLLFGSYTRMNTNDLAHELLLRFGTLEGVLNASREELLTVPGIGERSAELILSVRVKVGEFICRQFEGSRFTCENAPFLADWFLGGKPEGKVCWIECDEERQIAGITVEPLPAPDRESLLAFAERMRGRHGILLILCGKAANRWNTEAFAFLDGALSMSGGRLWNTFVLRERKFLRVWKEEPDHTDELSVCRSR